MNENFIELKKVKCCIPFCEEDPIMTTIPIGNINLEGNNFDFGKTIPICHTHITYCKSRDITFNYDRSTDKIKILWSETVNMLIEEKKKIFSEEIKDG